jgi:D-alanyl-D-alanine carboxypeptidase/D-alanyl-D-alanine-endopeptidase (penicillin-binding protein 4)
MYSRRRIITAFAAAAFTIAAVPAHTGGLDPRISTIMHGQRYRSATWSLFAVDLDSGKTVAQLNADRLAYTGSVRKLFSVSTALETLGAAHRFTTPVYRRGTVRAGVLTGDLILVGAGDLTFGGRLTPAGTIEYTPFDHNDANNLGTAILTPQDPLLGLNTLARAVRASGIVRVRGDVIVDNRLFQPYRVPNGNLLITSILINENMVDLSLAPTSVGRPASLAWRPQTDAFTVRSSVTTVKRGSPEDVTLSNRGLAVCSWPASCVGNVTGSLPIGYKAPLSGSSTFVRTFRIEQPASFARIAFVQALKRAGVRVDAPAIAPNAESKLPLFGSYSASSRVASFTSPPYAQDARLILKVSLNLGANLSLSLAGVARGERTITGALRSERAFLQQRFGIAPASFDFPTNGSGSPDSRATARAVVKLLSAMSRTRDAAIFRSSLPILGVDGSLADTGTSLPARGHVFAKTGTTVNQSGLKAQVLAGYILTKKGRHLAFALFVNNVGPLKAFTDITHVFDDEAAITNILYERN